MTPIRASRVVKQEIVGIQQKFNSLDVNYSP